MKKKTFIYIMLALALTLATGICTYASSAYYTRTRSIPSVRISISTGELDVGDDLRGSADSYVSVPSSNQYYELDYAEWLDDVARLGVGDSPRMRVVLAAIPKETESSNYSTIYLFNGSYSPNNVSVNGGELISADRRDSGYTLVVTLRVNAVKGTYDEPASLYWDNQLGVARWEPSFNDSGYYDVTLYRGSRPIKRLYSYHGDVYNFYPYMTEEGEYRFEVKTVTAPGKTVGKNSSWAESSRLYIDVTEVSDGSGQTTSDEVNGGIYAGQTAPINPDSISGQYGWINQGGARYFRYPDGTLATGWVSLSGSYYRFDENCRLMTGWYKNDYGYWFYLDPGTGAMKKGWYSENGYNYYLRPDGGDYEGTMVTGWADIDGKKYYFEPDGRMVTGWKGIDGKFYYFYPQTATGGDYGFMAAGTQIGDFFVGPDGAWIQ